MASPTGYVVSTVNSQAIGYALKPDAPYITQVNKINDSLSGNIIATVNAMELIRAKGIRILMATTWRSVPSIKKERITEQTNPEPIIAAAQMEDEKTFE